MPYYSIYLWVIPLFNLTTRKDVRYYGMKTKRNWQKELRSVGWFLVVISILLFFPTGGWSLLIGLFGVMLAFITVGSSAEKKCPLCAEFVKAEAVKCKHCGATL